MSKDSQGDRRRQTGDFRTRPRSSPASLMILTVSGVLLATAAATALLGGGASDATPQGQLLGTLEAVAESQEEHYGATGSFAGWEGALEVEVPEGVDIRIVHASRESWEALATDPGVGLSCMQSGSWLSGRQILEPPICYR